MRDIIDVRPNPIVLFPGAATKVSLRKLTLDDHGSCSAMPIQASEYTLAWSTAGTPTSPAPGTTWKAEPPEAIDLLDTDDETLALGVSADAQLDASQRFMLQVQLNGGGTAKQVPVLVFSSGPIELRVRNRQVTLEKGAVARRTLAVVARFLPDPDDSDEPPPVDEPLPGPPGWGWWWNVSMNTWLEWTHSASSAARADEWGTLEPFAPGQLEIGCQCPGYSPGADSKSKVTVIVRPPEASIPLTRLHGDPRAERHVLFVADGFTTAQRGLFHDLAAALARELRTRKEHDPIAPERSAYWLAWRPSPQLGVPLFPDDEEHMEVFSEVPDTYWGVAVQDARKMGLAASSFWDPAATMGFASITPSRWNEFVGRLIVSKDDALCSVFGPFDPARWKLGLARPNDPIVIIANARHKDRGSHASLRASQVRGVVHTTVHFDSRYVDGTLTDGSDGIAEGIAPPVRETTPSTVADHPLAVVLTAAALAQQLGRYWGLGDESVGVLAAAPTATYYEHANLHVIRPDSKGRDLRGRVEELPWFRLSRIGWAGRVVRVDPDSRQTCTVALDLESAGELLAQLKVDGLAERSTPALHCSPAESTLTSYQAKILEWSFKGAVGDQLRLELMLSAYPAEGDVIGGPRSVKGKVPAAAWSLIAPVTRQALDDKGAFEGSGGLPPRAFGEPPRTLRVRGEPADLVAAYSGGAGWYEGIVHPAGRCKMGTYDGLDETNWEAPAPYCFVCRYLLALTLDPARLRALDREYVDVR